MGITIEIIDDWTDITVLIPVVAEDKKRGFVGFLFPSKGSEYLEPALVDIIRRKNHDRPDADKYRIRNLYKGVSKQASFNVNDCLSIKRANDVLTAKPLLEEISNLLQNFPCSVQEAPKSILPPEEKVTTPHPPKSTKRKYLEISPAILAPRTMIRAVGLHRGPDDTALATFIGWRPCSGIEISSEVPSRTSPRKKRRLKTTSASPSSATSISSSMESSSLHTGSASTQQAFPSYPPPHSLYPPTTQQSFPMPQSCIFPPSMLLLSAFPPPLPFSYSGALTNNFLFFNNHSTSHNTQGTSQTSSSVTCSCSSTSTSTSPRSNPNP